MDRQHAQNRIKNLVQGYKTLFPEEYKSACEGVIMQRQIQKDEFASLGGNHVAERILHEIPEKLYMSLVKELSAEELDYWKSKEGGRWFADAFPQFSLTKV